MRLHRTVINIVDIKDNNCIGYVCSWNPDKTVTFSLDILPLNIKAKVIKDIASNKESMLFAKVNTGALDNEELIFKDFELCNLRIY